jgi:Raf kinase inhibitor-like YbhB/YbcL family protein
MAKKIFILLFAVILLAACQTKNQTPQKEREGIAMAIRVESAAFEEGATIPTDYTCDGEDLSPPLAWGEVPEGTKSIALMCDDPDAPRGTWVHWVIFGLPAGSRGLPEGIPAERTLASGARQGTNDFRRIGYGGPCPPRGPAHRYYFKVYALDIEPDLSPGASKQDLIEAMEGHILAKGELMGRYQRR